MVLSLYLEARIRIRIKVKGRIRNRIKVTSRIRTGVRMKVTSRILIRIRIRIKGMRIRNTVGVLFLCGKVALGVVLFSCFIIVPYS
jgi:hypothetical protein